MTENPLDSSSFLRLRTQLDSLNFILRDASQQTIDRRPPSGKWSARENLAHLARYHEVFLERLRRILEEHGPQFSRYRAEDDPQWPEWTALPAAEVLARLRSLRAQLIDRIHHLSPDQAARTGTHPTFGKMTVPEWIEFFLLHEAHHLYIVVQRVHESG